MNSFIKIVRCLLAITIVELTLALVACTPDNKDKVERLKWEGHPMLVLEAPDGTKLWESRVYHDYDNNKYFYYTTVYFSSRGTQYQVPNGKTTRTERVPNAD